MKANLLLVIALIVVAVLSLWLLIRALRRGPVPEEPEIELLPEEVTIN